MDHCGVFEGNEPGSFTTLTSSVVFYRVMDRLRLDRGFTRSELNPRALRHLSVISPALTPV